MLYALLEEHDPAVEAALARESLSPAEVQSRVKRAIGTGEDRMWEGILVTPRVRRIVSRAETAAVDREIEPLDLFEAIRAEGGLAAELLVERARA